MYRLFAVTHVSGPYQISSLPSIDHLAAPPPDLVFMNSASCPDPGLPGDFHRGWEGGVGTRSGVSNGCSIGCWAGQQGLGNTAKWLDLRHHKTRSANRNGRNKIRSEFCCELYGEFSCEFCQR